MSTKKKLKGISRRDFIKAAGAGVVAAGLGANIIIPPKARAGRKKLKILKSDYGYRGVFTTFEKWFNNTYVKEWGENNNTEVIVDNSGWPLVDAANEVIFQEGHDLIFASDPMVAFEDHVIDHREIWEECERKYGKPTEFAVKEGYNPKTKKHFALCLAFWPQLLNYRKDLWDDVGIFPDSWNDVRVGGRKIKQKHGKAVGIGLNDENEWNRTLRTIMYSFGASVQDEEGNIVLNSKQTLEAVKFIKALYEETMIPDVTHWGIWSHSEFMTRGNGSLVINDIWGTREAEKKYPEISKKIHLAKPPQGSVGRVGSAYTIYSVIWKFAENIEGAKKFLIDYIGNSKKAFLASEFLFLPCFPNTVSDLKQLIADDPQAHPPTKYKVLGNALDWTTNIGHPGYNNQAIDEVFVTWVIPEMFRKVATSKAKPDDAIKEAEAKCKRIFANWREKGFV